MASRFHDDTTQFPDEWDGRVVELVEFVEATRGLSFDHPVEVYFLTNDEYSAVATGGDAPDPTQADHDDADRQVAMLRALGVVEGEPDLLASGETIADAGTLAFYDTERKVVNVRGEVLTVGLRVTLVHELTHALQDQHFTIVDVVDSDDAEASAAARSVVEGDAVNVEQAYVEELDEEERAEYETESGASTDGAEADLSEVPDFLTTVFAAPYYLGPSFMLLFGSDAAGDVSPAETDRILDRPPLTMGHLFDPAAQLAEVDVAAVDTPLPDEDAFDRSTLGPIVLFSMLAARVDPVVAMAATDGWRGDAYTAIETDGRMCVTVDLALAGEADASELADALETWAEGMPGEADAEVDRDAASVELRTCDPGADAALPVTTAFGDALLLPVVRLQFAFGQTLAGVELEQAICVSDRVVRELGIDDLTAEELSPELEQRLTQLTTAALAAC